MKQGQILKIHSDFYYVASENEQFECKLREVLKKQQKKICVGDYVEFDRGHIITVNDADQAIELAVISQLVLDFYARAGFQCGHEGGSPPILGVSRWPLGHVFRFHVVLMIGLHAHASFACFAVQSQLLQLIYVRRMCLAVCVPLSEGDTGFNSYMCGECFPLREQGSGHCEFSTHICAGNVSKGMMLLPTVFWRFNSYMYGECLRIINIIACLRDVSTHICAGNVSTRWRAAR